MAGAGRRGSRETVKLVLLAGRYAIDIDHGPHYAMARNLAFELRAAYDAALARPRRAGHADAADHRYPDRRRRARRSRSTSPGRSR